MTQLNHLAHIDTRPYLGFCEDCVIGTGHNVWPVYCQDCKSMMISTRSGFQCPECDAHEACSGYVCGYDKSCGLNAPAS